MLSKITHGTLSERLASSQSGHGERPTRISTRHQLLSNSSRAADVQELELAIGRFTARQSVVDTCEVALFEIVGDEYLHCNVTHRYATKAVTGWAGPGHVLDGFVHNRRFRDTPQKDIIRHIRDMVCAAQR